MSERIRSSSGGMTFIVLLCICMGVSFSATQKHGLMLGLWYALAWPFYLGAHIAERLFP